MIDKFTPPTTFPHECLDDNGSTVILLGMAQDGERIIGEYLFNGDWRVIRLFPSELRNKPKVVSTWQNVYPDHAGFIYASRTGADNEACYHRINVLRRDTINGVTTCELEDV